MPGAKHSSLKGLSPSNYGCVRRKRSPSLLDPGDPSLNVETRKGSSGPIGWARRLTDKASAPPRPLRGDRKFSLPGPWFPSGWIRELTCVPREGQVSPFLEPSSKDRDLLLIQQLDKMEGLLEISLPPGTDSLSFAHMQAQRNHVL